MQDFYGVHFLDGDDALVITRSATNRKDKSKIGQEINIQTDSNQQATIMGWGPNNDEPAYRERLVTENNIVPSLMATRRDITLGQGIFAYRKRYEKGQLEVEEVEMPKSAMELEERLQESGYWTTSARNLLFHAAVPTELIFDKAGRIDNLKAKEMRHLRAERMDGKGKIHRWYWSGYWGHRQQRKNGQTALIATPIPVYQPNQKYDTALLVATDNLLCIDEYYPVPYWWGSEEWIRLANCIPEFHQSNLKHGYTIRWHIEIPKGYFKDSTYAESSPDKLKELAEAESAAKRAFLDRLNKLLKGQSNVGRSVVTEYDIARATQKEFGGIKITPLNVDMKDEALLKLFEKGNQAVISSQGVHPTLANIETQGKLSSGTEIRNAYLMYLAIKTPLPRKLLLRAWNLTKRINGWDKEIYYGFRDMTLERLSESKDGTGQRNEATE